MSHPLDGAVLRIQRARDDQRQLDAEIAEARRQSPYQFLVEPRPARPHARRQASARQDYVIRARLSAPPNPFWGVIAGEIIYNLRCALDYIVYQAAIEREGKDPPSNAELLQFPIVTRATHLRTIHRNRVTMAAIGPKARALVRRVQPYAHRKDRTLRLLQAVSNHDKHRAALVTTRAVMSGDLAFEIPGGRATNVKTRRGPIEDGSEIGSFTVVNGGPAGAQMKVSAQFSYNEIFDSPAELRGRALIRTLDQIRRSVERTLREANPIFAQRPYEASADEYRRHERFRVRKAVLPSVAIAGGCRDRTGPHWSIEQVTVDGYDVVHRGDPHHDGYEEPEVVFEANP